MKSLRNNNLRKLYYSIYTWGFKKTLFKVIARSRPNFLSIPSTQKRSLAVIGCGQFSFSTLGSAIIFSKGNIFKRAYDISNEAMNSFSRFYSIKANKGTINDILNDKDITIVYICSSHSTHATYAKQIIEAGKNVHIEKPIAIDSNQLKLLKGIAKKNSHINITTGFNRPHSPYIKRLKKLYLKNKDQKVISNMYIAAHYLEPNHWYKNTQEGGRISGNCSHWLDLIIHILRWSSYSSILNITIIHSDQNNMDENLTIVISSSKGDLFTLTFTALIEPILGVTEQISIQTSSFTSYINNFKGQVIDDGFNVKTIKTRKKDCGHEKCLLQQFNNSNLKDRLNESFCSTALTIAISNSILQRNNQLTFEMNKYFD